MLEWGKKNLGRKTRTLVGNAPNSDLQATPKRKSEKEVQDFVKEIKKGGGPKRGKS